MLSYPSTAVSKLRKSKQTSSSGLDVSMFTSGAISGKLGDLAHIQRLQLFTFFSTSLVRPTQKNLSCATLSVLSRPRCPKSSWTRYKHSFCFWVGITTRCTVFSPNLLFFSKMLFSIFKVSQCDRSLITTGDSLFRCLLVSLVPLFTSCFTRAGSLSLSGSYAQLVAVTWAILVTLLTAFGGIPRVSATPANSSSPETRAHISLHISGEIVLLHCLCSSSGCGLLDRPSASECAFPGLYLMMKLYELNASNQR